MAMVPGPCFCLYCQGDLERLPVAPQTFGKVLGLVSLCYRCSFNLQTPPPPPPPVPQEEDIHSQSLSTNPPHCSSQCWGGWGFPLLPSLLHSLWFCLLLCKSYLISPYFFFRRNYFINWYRLAVYLWRR